MLGDAVGQVLGNPEQVEGTLLEPRQPAGHVKPLLSSAVLQASNRRQISVFYVNIFMVIWFSLNIVLV